ncbi:MAG: hydroxymethylbilane synthase [Planctomycetes bacterium]|nr:hydroxymethylbilane synthase [Planctomycetota bacterium]
MSALVIGTRGSALARRQAERVASRLREHRPELEVRLAIIATHGDRHPDAPLHAPQREGLFTGEIEACLLDGRIDLAVHSLKDLPTAMDDRLVLAAVAGRADPADALIAAEGLTLDTLPAGGVVLTGSPRRAAQVLQRRPDLRPAPLRGNVDTRLRKFDASDAAGMILACAGLERLGLTGRITERLDPIAFCPACGQGALAVQARAGDAATLQCAALLHDAPAAAAVTAERAYLAALGGGCQVPAGAYGRWDADGGTLRLTAMLATPDGSLYIRRSAALACEADADAARLGAELAATIIAEGGFEILKRMGRGGLR